MDTFCFRKAITKYRSHSYNSIDYCPSSILLGNRFHIFHPLTKVVQRQSSLREKVCSILLYLLTFLRRFHGKKNEESQKEFVTFLLLVCKNPHYIGWSEWVKKGKKKIESAFLLHFTLQQLKIWIWKPIILASYYERKMILWFYFFLA